ncbi:MAG: DUF2993 domain-containing protein [Cyanobacteriota bacterium]
MTHFQPQSSDPTTADYEAPALDPQAPVSLPDPDRNLPVPRQSHIISTVLTPALRLWLRSQVEHVDDLNLLIEGGDRQLLTGLIPRVTISARNVVYRGLYLERITLVGRGIKVNFRQILRGKPLQLERTVPVQAEVRLSQQDLNDSLQGPLLAGVVNDLLLNLLKAGAAPDLVTPDGKTPILLDDFRAKIAPGLLTLGAALVSNNSNPVPFIIRTGLRTTNGQQLHLVNPEWLRTPKAKRGLALHDLDGFPLELGSDVEIQDLELGDRYLICRGKINVVPE